MLKCDVAEQARIIFNRDISVDEKAERILELTISLGDYQAGGDASGQ
jgi:hypothetical protein